MPQTIFTIAASADDAYVAGTSGTYPPASGSPDTTAVTIYPIRDISGGSYRVSNGLVRWDTSVIPDTASVTAATLRVRVADVQTTDSLSLSGEWYTWTPPAASGNYTTTPSSTAFAGIAINTTNFPLSTDVDIALLSLSGFSEVSLSSYTGMRIHVTQRAADAAPVGLNYMGFTSYDGSTTLAARLIVDYTVPNQETLRPTSVQLTSLSGAATDIDDDPDSPDSLWLTGTNPVGLTNGPEYPNARAGATGQTAFTWDANIANATDTSDSTSTTDASTTTTKADYFTIPSTGFNDIPSTATITGFSVDIKHRAGTANRVTVFLQLGTANGTLIGSEQTAATNLATTAGGVTHTVSSWGATPTRAQLIAGTFGIRLRVTRSPTAAYDLYSIKATATYDDATNTEARVAMGDPVGTLAIP